MKKRTTDAARSLQLHPFNLMLHLVEINASFEDVWPEIDDDWVETVRGQDWSKFGNKAAQARGLSETTKNKHHTDLGVSKEAAKVIEKLYRQKKWGKEAVGMDTLRNHYCQQVHALKEVIEELVQKELVLSPQSDGPYSLNPKSKGDIERIVNLVISKKTN
jgi:hypothetical protein